MLGRGGLIAGLSEGFLILQALDSSLFRAGGCDVSTATWQGYSARPLDSSGSCTC